MGTAILAGGIAVVISLATGLQAKQGVEQKVEPKKIENFQRSVYLEV